MYNHSIQGVTNMSNSKCMPDLLLENVFITMTDLTNTDILKWKIFTDPKTRSYCTTDNAIILNNRLDDSSKFSKYTSTLNIEYGVDGTDTEFYLLNNITYPRGDNTYRGSNWDKLYYNLVTSIIQSVLRHGSTEYNLINYLAKIKKQTKSTRKCSNQ